MFKAGTILKDDAIANAGRIHKKIGEETVVLVWGKVLYGCNNVLVVIFRETKADVRG